MPEFLQLIQFYKQKIVSAIVNIIGLRTVNILNPIFSIETMFTGFIFTAYNFLMSKYLLKVHFKVLNIFHKNRIL